MSALIRPCHRLLPPGKIRLTTVTRPRLRPLSSTPITSRHQSTSPSTTSTSSTSKPQLPEFLVVIPDHKDTAAIRSQAQPHHATQVQPLLDAGDLTLGSVILDDEAGVAGSVIMLHAETEDAVWRVLREDAYATAGVWDLTGAKVWRVKTGIRTAL